MNGEIAAILAMDGIASGAIYVLIGLGLVLIFAVTRVIFVPFGDIAAFTALSLASLETGGRPGTVGLVAVLAVLATAVEAVALVRNRAFHRLPRALLFYLVLPLIPAAAVWFAAGTTFSMPVRIVLSLALVLPIAPLLDRIVFRPIADASVLLLLTVAVALHFALSGLGLMFFGPEGVRTKPLTDAVFDVAGLIVNGQMLLILAASIVFCGLLFLYFEFTIQGKALRATAVNRVGARLVGIRPTSTGTIAYLLASLLAGISGVLIAPVTTIFYDSGFLLGLKAFVGAIIGAMVSYPVTALGAVMVGLLESFTSFWLSAYKEVLVFSLLIPVLLWRSLAFAGTEEEEAEE
ncbi:branched-chain amino acid ABC transporter permease [Reyranella soli]|jgi:branched-chain amino acid transport system permease protein|uniref:Branched-chain amino acid ABC transporter permease n=1 Tax=Reyranella soli TaxID=1230389 RepID=A0A512NQG4_9HYPH|nr:branched-chain amino acid ABC transporter permease [Reyranella soli]GEP61179.1 branched-chain amino acid ABC transporter permease [Reyranella soli]